jgi:hypothetical protein
MMCGCSAIGPHPDRSFDQGNNQRSTLALAARSAQRRPDLAVVTQFEI